MNKVIRFPDRDRIEAQACDWLARLDSGNITEAESLALQAWLHEDEQHPRALIEMAELLDRMTVLSRLNRLFPLDRIVDARRQPHYPARLTLATVAACIALLVVWDGIRRFESPTEYITAKGERQGPIQLLDGSAISINTDSRVVVEIDEGARHVELHQGEALFEVAYDAERPFQVMAGNNRITAISTAFNVELDTDTTEVTVTEGTVQIDSFQMSISFLGQMHRSTEPLLSRQVNAGEIAFLKDSTIDVQPIQIAAIDTSLSWRHGELVFTGESLEEVVAEIGRYEQRELIITDDAIRQLPVGGRFQVGDIDNLLDILEHGFGVNINRADDGKVYLAAGRPAHE